MVSVSGPVGRLGSSRDSGAASFKTGMTIETNGALTGHTIYAVSEA
jgi:hypothetical protein